MRPRTLSRSTARTLSRAFSRAARHPGLMVGTYLIAAAPAWFAASPLFLGLWSEAGGRPAAAEWGEAELLSEFLSMPTGSTALGFSCLAFFVGLGLVSLVRLLFGAGVVETLLERGGTGRGGTLRSFLRGIAQHSGRHAMAALWIALISALALFAAMIAASTLGDLSAGRQDERYQVYGLLALIAIGIPLVYGLSWTFDLARIALAERSRGSAMRSLASAAGNLVARPIRFAVPMALVTSAPIVLIAAAALWSAYAASASGGDLVIAWLGQQMLFLLAAAGRIWRWALAVEIYLGLGAPAWPLKPGQRRPRPALYGSPTATATASAGPGPANAG